MLRHCALAVMTVLGVAAASSRVGLARRRQPGPVLAVIHVNRVLPPLFDAPAGQVLIGDNGDRIRVIDLASGRVRRTITLQFPFYGFANPSMTLDAPRRQVFVLCGPGYQTAGGSEADVPYLSAYDIRTGRLIRTVRIPGAHYYEASTVLATNPRSGRVFVLIGDQEDIVRTTGYVSLATFDARTLRLTRLTRLQEQELNGDAQASSVQVAPRANRVFVARYGADGIEMLDATSGRLLRTTLPPALPNPSNIGTVEDLPILDARLNRLYGVEDGLGGVVTIFDATSGRLLHSIFLDQRVGSLILDTHTRRLFVLQARAIRVLDAVTGRLVRTLRLPHPPPALAGGVNPLHTEDGQRMRAVLSGITSSDSDENGLSGLVDDQSGHVFVADAFVGIVGMYDNRDGRLLRTITFHQPDRPGGIGGIAFDRQTGRLLVTDGEDAHLGGEAAGPGRLSVLDARNGAPLHSLHVGLGAIGIVVEQQSRRALVSNYDGYGALYVLDMGRL